MDILALPISQSLGFATTEDEVAKLFGLAADNQIFTHWAPIKAAPISGRIFATTQYYDMATFREPGTVDHVARELCELIPLARYVPFENPGKQKGWEIRRSMLGGKPAAIAWAAWC